MIPADREFLKGLRELCDETGTLLVFDEVITGFRLGLGGGQGYFNVRPDLTVLGKVIGGGLPIGAVSGRRDIMEHMDHTKYSGGDYCFQGGTGAANVLTLAAGEATIRTLMDEPVYDKIDRLGQNLRTRLSETFSRSTLGVRVTGVGSLFGIHFTREKFIRDTRHLSGQYKEQAKQMFSHLLNNGILLLSTDLPHGAISYSHSENEIDTLVFGIQDYLQRQAH
jgi:glutamate-1-semialdehyde 2,1-aminomutase